MKAKLLLIISMFFGFFAFSQSVKTLEYNVGTGTFTGLLPFDQPFNLKLVNIPRGADSVKIRLIEVPKKNYHQISKWKKEKGLNWKVLTADDVIKWKHDGIESFQFLIDERLNLTDTFHTIPVPVYLKPESKYLIKVECIVRRALTDSETESLVTEIKNNKAFKSLVNQLINKNIKDPDASSKDWGTESIRLQNIAQQVVKAKHPDYVVNEINYETQLESLSNSLTAVKNLSSEIVEMNDRVDNALNNKTNDTIEQVSQRHKAIQDQSIGINWPRVKETDAAYKNFLKRLNSVLYNDSLLLDKPARRFIGVARNNIIQILKDARAKKVAGETLKNDIAKQLIGVQSYINSNLQKSDKDLLEDAKKRHDELTKLLERITWVDLKVTSPEYKNLIQRANDVFAKDSVLLPAHEAIFITDTKNSLVSEIKTTIEEITSFIDALARWTAVNTFKQGTIGSTNSESLLEQAKLHVTFDLGYAYVWQMDRTNAYAGINIYFRPIDTSLPLKNYRRSPIDFIGSRTSLLVGLSVQSIQKDSVRKGIIGNNALVTGLGFRLLPWFKINGGAYMYYLYSRNPLRTKSDYSFKASPFVSLSIDFNLSSFFETFGNGSITNIFKK